jgi:N-ethylmaleimide reductase
MPVADLLRAHNIAREIFYRRKAKFGSILNRVRLDLEVVEAVTTFWGGDRVGIRISPVTPHIGGISDSDPQPLFNLLVEEFNRFGLLYLHMIEGETRGACDYQEFDFMALRKRFNGRYMVNNGYTKELALHALENDRADLLRASVHFQSRSGQ